jgi:nucleoside phosphorylase
MDFPHEDRTESVRLAPNEYTIGWITALHMEPAAATAMLDRWHEKQIISPEDSNSYVLGNIGTRNIAISCLPSNHYGTNNAAIVASNMRRTFPRIDTWLMIGIGGGVPQIP